MAGAAVTDSERGSETGAKTGGEFSSTSTARGTSVRYTPVPGEEPLRVGRPLVVAIDGPSGSGKSSVSKEVARRLRLAYLDTGAMYRAVTWDCLDRGIDLRDSALVEASARALDLELSTSADHESVTVRGHGVTEQIREPQISQSVSAVATNLGVRNELIRRQRALIAAHGRRMVVEGRDITTVVARDAEVRLLLTASEEARMRRRGLQLGGTQTAEDLHEQVVGRDLKDSTVASFTQAADGVYTLDSSNLDFEETVEAVLAVVHAAVAAPRPGTEPAPTSYEGESA